MQNFNPFTDRLPSESKESSSAGKEVVKAHTKSLRKLQSMELPELQLDVTLKPPKYKERTAYIGSPNLALNKGGRKITQIHYKIKGFRNKADEKILIKNVIN